MMKKSVIRGLVTQAVLLAVLSVVAFVLPFVRTSVFWLGYLFGILAIAVQFYVYKISFAAGTDAKSKFYGMPIARIGLIYLVVQLLVSLVEMAAAAVLPWWLALVVNIILAAWAVLGCLAAESVRDEVERQDARLKMDTGSMRRMQAVAAGLADICADSELKTLVKGLAEQFRYSDPVSAEATAELEQMLEMQLNDLKRILRDGDCETAKELISQIADALAERNRCCALTK